MLIGSAGPGEQIMDSPRHVVKCVYIVMLGEGDALYITYGERLIDNR